MPKMYSRSCSTSVPFPAVVSRLDDHTVLAVNLRTSELFGVPQSEAVGRLVTDYYVDPADRLRLADQIRGDGRVDNLRLQVRGRNGPFWGLVSSRLVAWRGEPAILTVFQDISDQLAAQTALKASERRLAAQSDALTSLTTGYAHPNRQFDERLRSILAISAQALQVERLSMWRVDEERQAIRCVGEYHRDERSVRIRSRFTSSGRSRIFRRARARARHRGTGRPDRPAHA